MTATCVYCGGTLVIGAHMTVRVPDLGYIHADQGDCLVTLRERIITLETTLHEVLRLLAKERA